MTASENVNPWAQMAEALRGFNTAVAQVGQAIAQMLHKPVRDAIEGVTVYIITETPGDWPDEYSVLNRYVRTGKRPTWSEQSPW